MLTLKIVDIWWESAQHVQYIVPPIITNDALKLKKQLMFRKLDCSIFFSIFICFKTTRNIFTNTSHPSR